MTQEPVQSTVHLNYADPQPRRWANRMARVATRLTGIPLVTGLAMISWAYHILQETGERWGEFAGVFFFSGTSLILQVLVLLPLMLIGALRSRPKFSRQAWLAMVAVQVLAVTVNIIALAVLMSG